MQVTKADAVAICQDYGLATADGWELPRLVKKLGQLIEMAEKKEFVAKDGRLGEIVGQLIESDTFEIVDELIEKETGAGIEDPPDPAVVDDSDDGSDEEWEDDLEEEPSTTPEFEGGEGDPKDCPLQGKEKVLVNDGEETWKAIVKEPITDVRVLVRDRQGKEWEVPITDCELVKVKVPKNEDVADKTIRELQEKVDDLKGDKKAKKNQKGKGKGKNLNRTELALKVIRESVEGITIREVSMEVEELYLKQGGKASPDASARAVETLVKFGVMFKVIEKDDETIRFIG